MAHMTVEAFVLSGSHALRPIPTICHGGSLRRGGVGTVRFENSILSAIVSEEKKSDANIIMTRLICTGTLTRSRSLTSPCCKAVKGVSRKHTGNLFFYCLLTEAERTLNKREYRNPKKGVVRKLSSFR